MMTASGLINLVLFSNGSVSMVCDLPREPASARRGTPLAAFVNHLLGTDLVDVSSYCTEGLRFVEGLGSWNVIVLS